MTIRNARVAELDALVLTDARLARDHLDDRVRHFARLRGAQRALAPSSADPLGDIDPEIARAIRKCLSELKTSVDLPDDEVAVSRAKLQELDERIDAYQKLLVAWVARLPLAQLRASLSSETHAERVEASALLQICLESEAVPKRLLHVVDFLITLLCARQREGAWVMDVDPVDLNDVIRARCVARHLETNAESSIIRRFQQAADRLASADDAAELFREISQYKAQVAGFYFVPSVLRCVVGYNIAARNHFQSRVRRGRERDAALDGDLGTFAPLQGDDPRAARTAGAGGLPAHEAPGLIAVQEAIRRRLIDDVRVTGPAERLAATLDLRLLGDTDRDAFLDPAQAGTLYLVRMTVVLGHLATTLADRGTDLAALSLHEEQLDAWICELADQVQREVDTLIRSNRYDGAVRLGEVKSRFLAAVRIVARRRSGRPVAASGESELAHEATDILRDYLARERLGSNGPVFMDLLGGGWRRTVALTGVGLVTAGLALSAVWPSGDPRRVSDLDARQVRQISPMLVSAYRDHASEQSMFFGTLATSWGQLSATDRRAHAELIRDRVLDGGVAELLLFDGDHVLRVHWVDGQWRAPAAGWGG